MFLYFPESDDPTRADLRTVATALRAGLARLNADLAQPALLGRGNPYHRTWFAGSQCEWFLNLLGGAAAFPEFYASPPGPAPPLRESSRWGAWARGAASRQEAASVVQSFSPPADFWRDGYRPHYGPADAAGTAAALAEDWTVRPGTTGICFLADFVRAQAGRDDDRWPVGGAAERENLSPGWMSRAQLRDDHELRPYPTAQYRGTSYRQLNAMVLGHMEQRLDEGTRGFDDMSPNQRLMETQFFF